MSGVAVTPATRTGRDPRLGRDPRAEARSREKIRQKRAEEGIDANFYFGGVAVSESAARRECDAKTFYAADTSVTRPE